MDKINFLNKEEYLFFISHNESYRKSIDKVIKHIYVRVQTLRLRMLGYSWGPANILTGSYKPDISIFDNIVKDNILYPNRIIVNYLTGMEMITPTKWLFDPEWEKELVELYKKEQAEVMLSKLEQ